jgi:hypothetical protein
MDHSEAVRLQAAEKYVLGELQGALRDEYEEHYFDCVECALDLQAAAAFVDTSRQVFREEAAATLAAARAGKDAPVRVPWVQRFRWAFAAVPAFAALVLVTIVSYQNAVTIPHLRNASTQAVSSIYGQTLELGAAGARRGGENSSNDNVFQIRASEAFAVAFDFTPNAAFPAYLCELQDPSGRMLLQVAVPAEKANQRYILSVPGGLLSASGNYRIVFQGSDAASGQPIAASEVQRFVLPLAFRQ